MKTKIILSLFLVFILASFVSAECTDSDGGKNQYIRGNVNNGYTDTCVGSVSPTTGWNMAVNEYYCENDSVKWEDIKCEGRCFDGACIKDDVVVSCNDSDSGLDYFTAGHVIKYMSFYEWDACLEGFSKPTLLERYCENGEGKSKDVICEGGCIDGACIRNDSVQSPANNSPPTPIITQNASVQPPISEQNNTSPSNSSSGGGSSGGSSNNTAPSGSGGGGSSSQCSNGCNLNGSCVAFGYRVNNTYCDLNKNFTQQKQASEVCENDFECSTNLCIDNKCVSGNVWQKFLKWISRLFG